MKKIEVEGSQLTIAGGGGVLKIEPMVVGGCAQV
jgi:hypothetical protein